MERGLHRFTAIGALVGILVFAGSAGAQQAGSNLQVDQLTAAMMGQEEVTAADVTEPKPLLGILEGVQANGSLNIGYSFNFNHNENAPGAENLGRVFDQFHNEFTVHNLILYIEKPADNDNLVGFAFTPALGKDSAFTQEANIAFGGNDLDVLQANVQIYTPDDVAVLGGTKFTIGKFLTTAGAEVIDAPYNDMFSRSILFGSIPFVHTGIKADTTLLKRDDEEDLLAASVGIANGWGNHGITGSGGTANFPTWLTNMTLSPGGMLDPSLTVNYFVGETSGAGRYRNLIDVVASLEVMEDLTLSGNLDWIGDEGPTTGYQNLWGFAAILRYDFGMMSDVKKWYVAMRGEFIDDRDGYLSGVLQTQVFDLTWTIGYKPVQNVILRTELRTDKANSDVFDKGDRSHQTTLSFDVSFLF